HRHARIFQQSAEKHDHVRQEHEKTPHPAFKLDFVATTAFYDLFGHLKTCFQSVGNRRELSKLFYAVRLCGKFVNHMILEQIRKRAAADIQHIVLPEGDDPRTIEAAAICSRDRVAKITVIGNEEKVRALAAETNANLNGVDVLDHRKSHDFKRFAEIYHQMRRAKGVTLEESEQTLKDPLYFGNLFVREVKADGSVAGATNTTAHTVAAAIRCIGVRQGFKIVSSFFLMVVPDKKFGEKGAMLYADCGVVVDQDATELAEIAMSSADSWLALLNAGPR